MDYYLAVWKKYFVFDGRSQRAEYWYFCLFNLIVMLLLSILDASFFSSYGSGSGYGFLSNLYLLAAFIPALAVTVRRLHDTNRSGWLVLIGLIPFIGFIVMLIFLIEDSNPGVNKYGPNPKEPKKEEKVD